MKRKLLILGVVICSLWIGGQLNKLIFSRNVGVIIIENNSTHMISSASITVCGQTLEFGEIQAEGYDLAFYDVGADFDYNV
jgi:hypothetical protein